MILSLDKKITDKFADISSGTKSSFTRMFNKGHQAIVRKKKGTTGAGDDSDSKSSGGEDEDVLIDENELAEIKKAKALEKA